MNTVESSGWIKIDLLVKGISIEPSVAEFLQLNGGVAIRKNFYNSPVWFQGEAKLPQEIFLLGRLIGLNSYGTSPWRLGWFRDDEGLQIDHSIAGLRYPIQLVPDLRLFDIYEDMQPLTNLYGGAALAFFSPRSCYFFSDETACGFCSLAGTAEESREFKGLLTEKDIRKAIQSALETDAERIEQVMIVGGNMRDLDRGFLHHVSLAEAASAVVAEAGLSEEISIHIATMPPRDLDLIYRLQSINNIHVMFNLEVWDPSAFSTVCPGKEKDYGRKNMLIALERLRDVVGPYRAHSLLVTGLEPAESTVTGARTLAGMGISPIINVYHSDRHSRLGLGMRPSFDQLAIVASSLQGLYEQFPLLPYWRRCGRNAIDAEAQLGLFRNPIPEFLTDIPARHSGSS